MLLALGSSLCSFGEVPLLSILSSSEADAIIAAEYQAKDAAREARLAKLNEATVKSEARGVLPSGQNVIIREVVPPSTVGASLVGDHELVELAEAAASQTIEPTPEQLANWQSYSEKEHHTIMLSATVYDRSITKLQWDHDSTAYVAYVNIDFNQLRSVDSVSNETHEYLCLIGIGEEVSGTMPDLPAFNPNQAEYFVTQGDPANTEAFEGIEALIAHFNSNKSALQTAHQRREALIFARERYKAANPEEPKEDFILQFWVPESANGKVSNE